MLTNKKVTGIVLCGGKSSRMGTEKGLVKWKGKALIEYSIEALSLVCNQIVISSNKTCYAHLNLPVVKDQIPDCGPLGGIYSCMNACSSDVYVVISCDVPNVPQDLVTDLLQNLGQNNAIIPVEETGKQQPLVAVYSNKSFSVIKQEILKGNYKMMHLLKIVNASAFHITNALPYYKKNMFANANSPDDICLLGAE